MFKDWKVEKSVINYSGDDEEKQAEAEDARKEYSEVAKWCNENQEYSIQENGEYYEVYKLPEPTTEEKQAQVRAVREQYFADYVDWYQEKPWLLEEMSEEEIVEIKEYREYLKDYTKEQNWYEKNPLDFNSWKGQNNEKTSSE